MKKLVFTVLFGAIMLIPIQGMCRVYGDVVEHNMNDKIQVLLIDDLRNLKYTTICSFQVHCSQYAISVKEAKKVAIKYNADTLILISNTGISVGQAYTYKAVKILK